MTKQQVDDLINEGEFPDRIGWPVMIETHISWVILCDQFAYKIKKPLQYTFLDFSTLEKRRFYCEREIQLNRRLTDNIYLDVVPVHEKLGVVSIGRPGIATPGTIIDYAVRMKKIDRNRQMNVLLLHHKVTGNHITSLAHKIADFHKRTDIIRRKDCWNLQAKFNDLDKEKSFLREYDGDEREIRSAIISQAVERFNAFMAENRELLERRMEMGFFRDCHGDLHSRNIFLLSSPEPFDCIEFNDEYRQIDVLNEAAFLCMDLEKSGRYDLSEMFISDYNRFFPSMQSRLEEDLFSYYKAYRANIRAKVNLLRAKSAADGVERDALLTEAGIYLLLMNNYLGSNNI